jgi:alpha-ketoglutarate-dependent taurine dioxygenase
MITVSLLIAESTAPLLVQCVSGSCGADTAIAWYRENFEFVERKLLEHGAILFRAFDLTRPSDFQRFVRGITPQLMNYVDGNSPRRKLSQGIYTSTEYPPEYFISLHNELSYSHKWPTKLFFFCMIEPTQGGETPIADGRKLIKMLDQDVVAEFKRKKVKYVRNLHGGTGIGPSWQETFETKDKREVERFCSRSMISFDWKPDGGLRLIQIGPGVMAHPKTGEWIWFNQATQFHPSTHPTQIYESLEALYGGNEQDLPQHACFGDDSVIDKSVLDHIREVSLRAAIIFPWQQRDILVIDNVLMSHGRMPFSGPRRILAAMS